VLGALIDHGRPGDDAAALIYRGTTPAQRTVTGTVAELLARVRDQESETDDPALLVVGEVTRLRDHLRWFDARPLFGRRIILTRSPERARELSDAIENLGAETVLAPTFRVGPPDDPEAVDRAAASIDRYDWVVFESAVAAARFLNALMRGPRDARALARTAICAIGPSTEEELSARGLKADVVIPELRVESIANSLIEHAPVSGRSVLIVRPDHERDVLAEALAANGAHVTDLVAYRTAADPPDSPAAQAIYRMLLDGKVDAVTFASPSAVQRFAALIGPEQAADLLNTTVVAAIGPVTAAAAAQMGIKTQIVPDQYTVDGLVAAMARYFARKT
jgi:uroporphyrinogen III methyltransferase/synthase